VLQYFIPTVISHTHTHTHTHTHARARMHARTHRMTGCTMTIKNV